MKAPLTVYRYYKSPRASALLSPYWRLAMIDQDLWDRRKRKQDYSVTFLPLAGGVTAVQSIAIKGTGPWIIYGLTAFANNPGATPPPLRWGSNGGSGFAARALVMLTDVAQQYNITGDVPVPLDNIAGGSGANSGSFVPYVVPARGVINISMTSMNVPGAGEDWNWFLTFHGAEVL